MDRFLVAKRGEDNLKTATMEVQMVTTKLIKPASPTPSHLRTLKLSPLDRQFSFMVKPCALYYYPGGGGDQVVERRKRLETSLSEKLSRYYPLAGRYMKETHSIDCNDDGVEYLEAKVEGLPLSQLLSRRDEMIPQLDHLSGGETSTPLASIQITWFDCGGIVIAVRIHHMVVDGFTAASFFNAWATASREGLEEGELVSPIFGLTSFFPEGNNLPKQKPMPPPKIFGMDKLVTRRLVLDEAKILSLKAKARDHDRREPSKVEVVTALIWRALMGVSQAKHGRLKTSLASHAVNLRPKIVPPLPPLCCGNLLTRVAARFTVEDSFNMALPDLKDLIGLLRDAAKHSIGEVPRQDLYSTAIKYRNEVHESIEKGEEDVFLFTSWCRFPFYEADFGWGNPVWISRTHPPAQLTVLLDNPGGDGIEAWVTLNPPDMLQFLRDDHILAFTSF